MLVFKFKSEQSSLFSSMLIPTNISANNVVIGFDLYEFFSSTLGSGISSFLEFVRGLLEGSEIIQDPIFDKLAETDRFVNDYIMKQDEISILTGEEPAYISFKVLDIIHIIKYALKLIR